MERQFFTFTRAPRTNGKRSEECLARKCMTVVKVMMANDDDDDDDGSVRE